MTRESYLKHKDLIEAWANGAEIEVYEANYTEWTKINSPMWVETATYRIKPKPKQTIYEWLLENNIDYVPNWKDEDISKWCIIKDTESNMWGIYDTYLVKSYGTVYMSKETAYKLVDLLNKGEVVEG